MHRFYAPELGRLVPEGGDRGPLIGVSVPSGKFLSVTLDRDESHHAKRVLRLQPGDVVAVFDGQGVTGRGVIDSFEGGQACLSVDQLEREPRVGPHLTIATAIPKGPRADAMVSQLCQVGADCLLPIASRRSVVDPRPAKLAKFATAAIESAKQCGRAYLMQVGEATKFEAAVREAVSESQSESQLKAKRVVLIASTEQGNSAADVIATVNDLHEAMAGADHVMVLIGPEGGWADEELKTALDAGVLPWRFGPHIMRIETAAVAAAALIRHAAV